VDALAAEPGVDVRVTASPDVVATADLVVLPGTRATVADLQWLRSHGLAAAICQRVSRGQPVLGICGGYQMLAGTIHDETGVESAAPSRVEGLGVLPTEVRFDHTKQVGVRQGEWRGRAVSAYAIHHGVTNVLPGVESEVTPFVDGWQRGAVWGTTWHGAFESDDFRRAFLAEVATQTESRWQASDQAPGFAARRESMLDRLADAVEEHLDTDALLRIIGV
ncbi:MAG: cobyric acid synthase, partial [Nocardioidaceae bacterium]